MLAAIKPLNIDPETMSQINEVGLLAFGALALVAICWTIWHVAPAIYKNHKEKRELRLEAANAIWFDAVESELHCGHIKKRIEPNSFEHFVCKITFENPSDYAPDYDIFEQAERAKNLEETKRGVEQAVRRLNKKGKEMGLKKDLFKRSKERTSVNDEYRERIVNS